MGFNQDLEMTSSTACLPMASANREAGISTSATDIVPSIASSGTRILDRPLRVMFIQTDMRIGGAEMITANVIRRLDRRRFSPELCCLKDRGALGEFLANEIPVHYGLLAAKYDLRVWPRLTRLLRKQKMDVVITVGAGDK